MEVVVVLPWVPATAMPWRKRISSASISARGTTGTRRAWASATSRFSVLTAEEVTTTSASPMFSARWPISTRAPRDRRWSTTGDSLMSLPLMA